MIFRPTSRRPIVIAGNGVRQSGAVDTLREFHEKTKIPVLTSMNAVDLIQGDSKLGFIGVYGNRVANMIVSQSDLVIAVGVRLGLRQVGNRPEYFAPNAHLIRADIDEAELSRSVKPGEEKHLVDARDFLTELMKEDIPDYSEWYSRCRKAKEMLAPYDKELGNLCMEKISSVLPADPMVAVDVGQNQCWTAQSLTLKGSKGRMLIGGGYGSMGCGLPYAIGASVSAGNGKVYLITGDGGLQMNIQELQTVYSEHLPIKILVIDNRALGKISEIQRGSYDGRMLITTADSGYTTPDFTKVAEAYGIKSRKLSSYEELDSCTDWLNDDEPCLIDIIMPDDTRLIPKMKWNEREMKPLLDRSLMDSVYRELNPDYRAD